MAKIRNSIITPKVVYKYITFCEAVKVLYSNPVMVIGPTPPGTGVIRRTLGNACSKCTSPFRRKPDFVSDEGLV